MFLDQDEIATVPVSTALRKHMQEKQIGDLNRIHGPFRKAAKSHSRWWDYANEMNLNPEELAEQSEHYKEAFETFGNLRRLAQQIYTAKIKSYQHYSDTNDEKTKAALRTLAYKSALSSADLETKKSIEKKIDHKMIGDF